MIIRRVEVRNFRKLIEPIAIENLPSGLVILVAENEEGKSTLLNAIRSCFFDKHNMSGQRAQSFQPYNSALRPEVLVDFEINGQPYKLFKAFCQKPQAELTTPTGRLADSAAEEELARLLRFTPPHRARRDDGGHEHEGVFGMFWVEQGKSFTGINPTSEGRSSIQQALQHEVGDVLGGRRGQRILNEVRRLRGELLTPTDARQGNTPKQRSACQRSSTNWRPSRYPFKTTRANWKTWNGLALARSDTRSSARFNLQRIVCRKHARLPNRSNPCAAR